QALMHTMIGALAPTYMALFTYRHQLIVPAGSRLKFSATAQISALTMLAIPVGLFGFSNYRLYESIFAMKNSTMLLEKLSSDWDKDVIKRIECII
ncbi:hypothetical protein PMAYCL1PPCAC_10514, partial [Pristionchus mayeri]